MAQAPSGLGGDPPDTPMEDGDPHAHSAKKHRSSKRSFADAVSSFTNTPSVETSCIDNNEWAFEDIDVVSDTELDAADMADGRPRVSFSKELRRELCSAWKMSIIIKYLGKNIHVNVLNQRLPGMWNLQGKMTLIDIGYGCFVARLDNKVDYLHVLLDGPWNIFDNYLVTQRWELGFRPCTARFSKMAVWVRLPELPMEYFRDDTIRAILENVGKPLKLDRTTVVATKGRFARAAVEIDLNKSLVSEVWVDNEVQLVEYEGLHVVCFHCGVVGHREQACPENKTAETEVPIVDLNSSPIPETSNNQQTQTPTPPPQVQEKRRFGTWMLVTKKSKPGDTVKNTRHSRKDSNISTVNRGNQYSLLADIHEDSEPTVHRQQTDKNKSKSIPRQTSKGIPTTFVDTGFPSCSTPGEGGDQTSHVPTEIKSAKADKMIDLAYTLGFNNHFLVNPIGFAGDLLLFWKQGHIDLEIVSHNSQAIHTRVNRPSKNCFITFAYVRPNLLAKCRFWDHCRSLSGSIQIPWLVLGDFNDIAGIDEQWGSVNSNANQFQRFSEAFGDCNLLDPGASGPKFTWHRLAGNRVIQMRRLDRLFWNIEAQVAFPEAKVLVLPRLYSDHNPILFVEEAGQPPNRDLRPIRFEAAWLNRDDYNLIWKEVASNSTQSFTDIISTVTRKSLLWNRNDFGNIFKRKQKLITAIQNVQNRSDFTVSRDLQTRERFLINDLNEVLDQEEAFWFQKSRVDWIKDGDRNTRFYQNAAVIRRNKNRIRFLKINGSWTDNHSSLSSHITDFFTSLFCRVDTNDAAVLTPVAEEHTISSTQAGGLCRQVSLEEVRKAVFGMKKYGSPGPDGIPAIFYQHFWSEVGPSLTRMVNQALVSGTIETSLLKAFMTLIPKKEVPETAADFRPITLLNVAFKAISKVLVNRLRPIMCKLIGPHQNSCLPGRSTMDNVILTQEVIHTMSSKKGKKGFMIVKVDLHKAYDSVSWSFLEDTLVRFGFPRSIIDLLLFSLRESDISILWNGGRLPAFNPGRGLRQGDPLAPYLFNLVMERLAYDIHNKVSTGTWKPIRICRGGIGISHLFFADDLMLFGEASEIQATTMVECLNNFSAASGLIVNLAKSTTFCSPNLNAGLRSRIKDILNIPIAANMGHYLGMPILQRRVSRHTFSYVVDKMRKKLATWKASALSMAGRRILVQSSLATVPTYSMQSLAFPVSTCSDIDRLCRNFLWGHDDNTRKIHTVNWSDICRPREVGGLGLRKARDFNMAFLTKMAWQLWSNQDKLWIGGWVTDLPLADAVPNGGVSTPDHITVDQFITPSNTWNTQALNNVLSPGLVDKVRAIALPASLNQVDQLTWPLSNSGSVSVASAFSFISGYDEAKDSHSWIWKITCVERVRLFIWKVAVNGLLTNAERFRWGLSPNAECPRCGAQEESTDHLLRQCDFAKECWEAASAPASFMTSFHLPLIDWMMKACTMVTTADGNRWHTAFPYLLWNMWKAHNNLVFNGTHALAHDIIIKTKREAQEAHRILLKHTGPLHARQTWVLWSPPQLNYVKMNSDGARKSSTGLASAGGLIRDHRGRWIVGFTVNIGHTSSFGAEVWGLREGLIVAIQRGFTHVIAESDSEALVSVIDNNSDDGKLDSTLIADYKALIRHFQEFRLQHILREGNQCADFLANLGQQSAWARLCLNNPLTV
ncbi:uncharacterized protein LOC116005700 [Ipomoea triloba]|uniref:uncharacterized protein LOC116005700 n=1 Tax=Ipomoea triloba TaxID=35885 RepID=UPI00125D5B55|nr:uncharacterized protein LOC116005700 [Ipomoea triloba]